MVLTVLLSILATGSPAVGDVVPDFTVKDTDGVSLQLSSLTEQGAVVLAFFPKAFTPG
jgi:peroxiredoxin Q/BCP